MFLEKYFFRIIKCVYFKDYYYWDLGGVFVVIALIFSFYGGNCDLGPVKEFCGELTICFVSLSCGTDLYPAQSIPLLTDKLIN